MNLGTNDSCSRCKKKLGLRKLQPRNDWGIAGKICKDCNDFLDVNAPVFEAEYKDGHSKYPQKMKGKLIVQNFDNKNRVLFLVQSNIAIEIPVESIKNHELIDYQEESSTKKIVTMGISSKSTSKHLKITYLDNSKLESPIFGIIDVQNTINVIRLLRVRYEKQDTKPTQEMIDVIKKTTGQGLADEASLGQLVDKHGEINKIMKFLEPDETVLFVTRQSRIMPGGSVIFTPNTIFATDRRIMIRNPTMLGLRSAMEDYPYDSISSVKLQVGVFTSTIVLTGPGFGEVNRMSRSAQPRAWGRGEESAIDAIPKKDAEELHKIIKLQMAKAKGSKFSFTQIINNNRPTESVQVKSEEDPLLILKKRLAKGEITKNEFEELKKTLES